MNFFRFKESEKLSMGVIENQRSPIKLNTTNSTDKSVLKVSGTKTTNNSVELPVMPKVKNTVKFGG